MNFITVPRRTMFLKKAVIGLALLSILPTPVAVAQPSIGSFGSMAFSNAASTMAVMTVPRPKEEKFVAELTAYTSRVGETDSDPFIAANGEYVYDGLLACSREYPFGTKVIINDRTYTCGDRMAQKNDHAVNLSLKKPRFDIWMESLADARQWGRRSVTVTVLYN
jgi:3D (Asp-Asp-Asp) domain-containing protein